MPDPSRVDERRSRALLGMWTILIPDMYMKSYVTRIKREAPKGAYGFDVR